MARKRTEAEITERRRMEERNLWELSLWHANRNAKAQGLVLTFAELLPLAQVIFDTEKARLEAPAKRLQLPTS